MRYYPNEQHEQMKHFSIGYFVELGKLCEEAVRLLEDTEHAGELNDVEARIEAKIVVLRAHTRYLLDEYQATMAKSNAQFDKLLELMIQVMAKDGE